MRNEELPKIRKFNVESINNESGFKMATNHVDFMEDKSESYEAKLNHDTPFCFKIKVENGKI